ncbi:Lsr2 family protein [Rhodococcus aerolatus]
MAQKVTVTLVDDIDDDSVAAETVEFAIDGVTYEIDLTDDNAQKLRNDFAMWTGHARKVAGRRRGKASGPSGTAPRGRGAADREQSAAVREWARRNGYEVSDRGRIPSSVVEAYNSAS